MSGPSTLLQPEQVPLQQTKNLYLLYIIRIYCMHMYATCWHRFIFQLQFKSKPYGGVALLVFILGAGVVTNMNTVLIQFQFFLIAQKTNIYKNNVYFRLPTIRVYRTVSILINSHYILQTFLVLTIMFQRYNSILNNKYNTLHKEGQTVSTRNFPLNVACGCQFCMSDNGNGLIFTHIILNMFKKSRKLEGSDDSPTERRKTGR